MKENILFLDIDGPMIPLALTYYLIDNPGDRIMSNVCVGILNNICRKTEAKIVTNTTHNIDHPGQATIREILIRNGVKEEYFHKDHKTIYGVETHNRMKAIDLWLYLHDNPNWVALDDEIFTDNPNLIPIDRDKGLDLAAMWKTMDKFGIKRHFLEF
jgi:hypothetical protein